jgi:hypothetical protein
VTADTDPRVALAHQLFEAYRIPNRQGYHLGRKGEQATLCGRPWSKRFPVHPSDVICQRCYEAAFAIVDAKANEEMHAAIGTPGDAPYAMPEQREKRRRWMRRGA